jgi:predicted acetyltransferase
VTHSGAAVRLAPLGVESKDDVLALDQWAFGFDPTGMDPEWAGAALEWDRVTGAWLPGENGDDALAGLCGVFSLLMSVPGPTRPLASIPVAGLTWVGVHPQYRRRGVMTALIHNHLRSVASAGREAVSVLFAAEPAIYGRFGYGLATRALTFTVPRGAALRPVQGAERVQVAFAVSDRAVHTQVVDEVAARVALHRPGSMVRTTPGLRASVLNDPPPMRQGKEPLRIATATLDGRVTGYAIFARESAWSPGGPEGTVHVRELQADDAATEAALWARLSDLDLMAKLSSGRRPVDDRLLHLLVDPRAAVPSLTDGQYVRVVDLPAALEARRYSHAVDVVLEITDSILPGNAGRWHLVAGPDVARCTRTERAPGLVLDIRELGSAYLGGETLAAMAEAGLVQASDAATLTAVSAAFRSHLAPAGCWVF